MKKAEVLLDSLLHFVYSLSVLEQDKKTLHS